MSGYTLLGSQMSPYTMKMYSYLQFKGVPFEWEERSLLNSKKFKKHAQVALIPMLFRPDGTAMQDSTLMMEQEIEPKFASPEVHPSEPAAAFVSQLLEEFGDEWCNKLMFFQRWGPKEDQVWTGKRLAELMIAVTWWGRLISPLAAKLIVKRMVPRLAFAGGSEINKPHFVKSWQTLLADMEAHLAVRPYFFGGRPSLGDFSIFGQIVEAYSDVSGGRYIRANHPVVEAWIKRMHTASVEGDFEALDSLMPTLGPLIKNSVAGRFLPWTCANARALDAGEKLTSLEFDGQLYQQNTFKYHKYSLHELYKKYMKLSDDPQLKVVLEETGCLPYFENAPSLPEAKP
ncbi:MAG: glutathione S-transferase family protein [Pseudomonadales bacterium]